LNKPETLTEEDLKDLDTLLEKTIEEMSKSPEVWNVRLQYQKVLDEFVKSKDLQNLLMFISELENMERLSASFKVKGLEILETLKDINTKEGDEK
jgi:hypothetical protein